MEHVGKTYRIPILWILKLHLFVLQNFSLTEIIIYDSKFYNIDHKFVFPESWDKHYILI